MIADLELLTIFPFWTISPTLPLTAEFLFREPRSPWLATFSV